MPGASGLLEIESLDKLITAVKNYQTRLLKNKKILKAAGEVCKEVMQGDAVSAKHIAQLDNALAELDKAAKIVELTAEQLLQDKKEALAVLDD